MSQNNISRRWFLSGVSTLAAAAAGLVPQMGHAAAPRVSGVAASGAAPFNQPNAKLKLDLSPAQWIWYPAKRILPNSFFHFRRSFTLQSGVRSARGWIVGDSRYVLFCNGRRIQFGPAPADPRFTEADPVNLTALLQPGENVVGATVLYYGFGDGTWPAGKPGFLFRLDIEYTDGTTGQLVSDANWQVQVARSWQPGMYKRWYLRALQESFDNRLYPAGWYQAGYQPGPDWKKALRTGGSASQTALATAIPDYLYDSGTPAVSQLRARAIPMVLEEAVAVKALVESHWIHWNIPSAEYFDLVTEDAYTGGKAVAAIPDARGGWRFDLAAAGSGLVVTFRMPEQVVGFPYFSIDAPAGTTIELMVQQGHVPYNEGGPALINNNLNSWTRFICREGPNTFMTFDYESVQWIQLHLHGASGPVRVYQPGVLRRKYAFPNEPTLTTTDPLLQKLFAASFNTVLNNSQDTIVDCMGRERQQYSGDIGHVVHALHRAYNERQLPARFISTYSQGLTLDGFFMDSWPAYDRLNRLSQRQLGLTPWGPLLDHSVGFNYDVWYHYLYTGRKEDLEEVFPRLVRFFRYLQQFEKPGGLFPVENLGVPAVWMDTDSYKKQRHKQCAFNLYIAGMLQDAFAPLCSAFGEERVRQEALDLSRQLVKAVRTRFWSEKEGMLINNLPWASEEGELRTCERSLAHMILSGFASAREKESLVRELEKTPSRLGLCYPPNAQWRYWALAAGNRIQPVIDELRHKWAGLPSVRQNNTMPEAWVTLPDGHAQYSHASLAPVYLAYMGIAGISILEPGGARIRIKPQPGDINGFAIANHTPHGPVAMEWQGKKGRRNMTIKLPQGVTAELWLDANEKIKTASSRIEAGFAIYLLPGGTVWNEVLRFT